MDKLTANSVVVDREIVIRCVRALEFFADGWSTRIPPTLDGLDERKCRRVAQFERDVQIAHDLVVDLRSRMERADNQVPSDLSENVVSWFARGSDIDDPRLAATVAEMMLGMALRSDMAQATGLPLEDRLLDLMAAAFESEQGSWWAAQDAADDLALSEMVQDLSSVGSDRGD